ncbi:stage II sporulation protein D [Virgibacillus sp. C22-A2]|uniref:Stage II sporulation protein D n=1 Tax=Virgibacillus tibetensis TaxID=3042313 RepID=A0ABU6KJA3_9BACI|nr:stage II sporulation protein D [Virgibacillus sp. C22-A2]
MRNHKYHSSSRPKAWKKKKPSTLTQIKLRQKANAMKSAAPAGSPGLKEIKPSKHKKPYYFNRKITAWKVPAIFLLSSLIIIILVIPTLIVIPFGKDEEVQGTTLEKEQEYTAGNDPSPFSVAVMRDVSDTVEDVPLETYIAGVVASEMPPNFEIEALKAQAIAARTYTLYLLLQDNNSKNYDLTDTVNDQVFRNEQELQKEWGSNYTNNMRKIREAVAATEGEIITHNSTPIFPAFFSTSNGFTENSEDYWENELPYLRSVKSHWDEESPKFLDQQVFSIADVENALEIDLPAKLPLPIEVTKTSSDRVNELIINGHTFSGRAVREKLELQSSDFTIKQRNDHLIFTTKGYGHGIGMSQYGANGMAKEGKTYLEIVDYYYQDVEVSTVTDTAPTLVSK